jgi:hypothetical protein
MFDIPTRHWLRSMFTVFIAHINDARWLPISALTCTYRPDVQFCHMQRSTTIDLHSGISWQAWVILEAFSKHVFLSYDSSSRAIVASCFLANTTGEGLPGHPIRQACHGITKCVLQPLPPAMGECQIYELACQCSPIGLHNCRAVALAMTRH